MRAGSTVLSATVTLFDGLKNRRGNCALTCYVQLPGRKDHGRCADRVSSMQKHQVQNEYRIINVFSQLRIESRSRLHKESAMSSRNEALHPSDPACVCTPLPVSFAPVEAAAISDRHGCRSATYIRARCLSEQEQEKFSEPLTRYENDLLKRPET